MKSLFVKCPFHSDGNERTPSLSILLQDKGKLKAGFSKCFSCGWSGNYHKVEEALGHPLDISPEIRAQLDKNSFVSTKSNFNLRSGKIDGTPSQPMNKEDLPFKFSPYLKSRGIGEVIQRFNKVYQSENLNMPFFDPKSRYMGFVERGVGKDKFYKVNGEIKFLLGIEELKESDFIYITEGQIDKMTLEEVGFRAVALGSVSNYRLIRYLRNFNICFAYDNDEAGKKALDISKKYLHSIGRYPNLYELTLPEQVKDVNEFLVDIVKEKESPSILTDWVKKNTILRII